MNSELRYNITAGDWVLFSPQRNKYSGKNKRKNKRIPISSSKCPFEEPQKNGNAQPHFWFPQNKPLKDWSLQIIPNKFPAIFPGVGKSFVKKEFSGLDADLKLKAFGYHDILILRDHLKDISQLKDNEVADVFNALQKRYKEISADKRIAYISMFHNWGPSAGASVYHPHLQIIALPVIPSDVGRSFKFSEIYSKKFNKCIHCQLIKETKKDGKRIVFENGDFIAFTPFASKEPYQVNVFPKKHSSHFEDFKGSEMDKFSLVIKKLITSIKKKIGDPDYNFFIHTSPTGNKKNYSHYHWHLEMVPRLNISAGFELGTGVEVNPVFPEEAAKVLKFK